MKGEYIATLLYLLIIKTTSLSCYLNCKQCNNQKICSLCIDGYFLTKNNQCKLCPPECLTCMTDDQGNMKCTGLVCSNGSTLKPSTGCNTCSPRCLTCNSNPSDCLTCKAKTQLQTIPGGTTSICVGSTSCYINRCNACLKKAVTTTGAPELPVINPICQVCQDGYFTFRRGCQKCRPGCSTCTYDYKSDWDNNVLSFWKTTLPNIQARASGQKSSRRLLISFTETYQQWNKTKYDQAIWTKAKLDTYDNMNIANVNGWTQAYYFFLAVSQKLPGNTTLDNMIYFCLPIMQELLNVTLYNNFQQWRHLARFVNHFLGPMNFRWTGSTLYNRISQLVTVKTICLSCNSGYIFERPNCFSCSINSNTSACISCVRINDKLSCTACQAGFYLSEGSCLSCNSSCATCTSSFNCLKCIPPFSLASGSCVNCTLPCKSCQVANLSKCTSCIQNYAFEPYSNGTCYQCYQLSCRQCDTYDLTKCFYCLEGYTLKDKKCVVCSDNCICCDLLLEILKCYQCRSGFTLVNNKCQKCADTCITCLAGDPNTCLTCQSHQYLNYVTGKCQNCKQGCVQCPNQFQCTKYINGSVIYQNYIVNCKLGCVICDNISPSICRVCKDRFFLNSFQQCERCSQGCMRCQNKTKCTQCPKNFILKDGVCIACPANCYQCDPTDSSKCINCVRRFSLSILSKCLSNCQDGCLKCDNNNVKTCIECDNGYTLFSGRCIECVAKCTGNCNNVNITECYSCMKGFYLQNNQCKPCSSGCFACTTNTTCTDCIQGYTYNVTGSTCSKSCLYPCLTCTISSCDSCVAGYILNSNKVCVMNLTCNPNCQYCLAGTYADGVSFCIACPTDKCSSCRAGICTVCFDGYYLLQANGIKSCLPCPKSCLSCYDASNCKICADGYVREIAYVDSITFDIVFSSKCIQCSSNCKTCSIYVNRCTSCLSGMRILNQRCFGVYTVVYRFVLNSDYNNFMANGQSQQFTNAILSKVKKDKLSHVLYYIKNGSITINGSISAQNLQQAIELSSALSGNTQIGVYPILSSSIQTAYNDKLLNDDKQQPVDQFSRVSLILGSVIGAVAIVVILTAIFVIYKRRKKQSYQQEQIVQIPTTNEGSNKSVPRIPPLLPLPSLKLAAPVPKPEPLPQPQVQAHSAQNMRKQQQIVQIVQIVQV